MGGQPGTPDEQEGMVSASSPQAGEGGGRKELGWHSLRPCWDLDTVPGVSYVLNKSSPSRLFQLYRWQSGQGPKTSYGPTVSEFISGESRFKLGSVWFQSCAPPDGASFPRNTNHCNLHARNSTEEREGGSVRGIRQLLSATSFNCRPNYFVTKERIYYKENCGLGL